VVGNVIDVSNSKPNQSKREAARLPFLFVYMHVGMRFALCEIHTTE
jgi:hypothetical protein